MKNNISRDFETLSRAGP